MKLDLFFLLLAIICPPLAVIFFLVLLVGALAEGSPRTVWHVQRPSLRERFRAWREERSKRSWERCYERQHRRQRAEEARYLEAHGLTGRENDPDVVSPSRNHCKQSL